VSCSARPNDCDVNSGGTSVSGDVEWWSSVLVTGARWEVPRSVQFNCVWTRWDQKHGVAAPLITGRRRLRRRDYLPTREELSHDEWRTPIHRARRI